MKKVILLLVGLFILLVSQVAASNYYDSRDSRYQYHFPNRDDGDRVYVTNNYYNYGGYGGQNSYSGGYYPVNYGPRYVAINYYDTYDYRFVDRSRYQRQVY
ncbi:MAG: hypothetical protein KKG59_02240, partial [Nanoarchaeota archaeon]|nr:hypothetical protein [Nanoarchaeota archaeon]